MTMQLMINIDVPDLASAQALYTQAFGLTVGRHIGAGAVELHGAATPVYLLQAPKGSAATGTALRDYGRHWTPLHLDVVVDHLEPALARALEAGMVQEEAIRESNWGRIVRLSDPFGHGWCLLQFIGRGYDEITT